MPKTLQSHPTFFNFGFLFMIRLVSRNYFFNYALPTLNFVFPFIISFISYEVLAVDLLIPGLLIQPILTVGMVALPNSLATWNSSTIMKRLKVSNISVWQILFGFSIFYFLIALASTGWLLVLTIIHTEINSSLGIDLIQQLEKVKWGLWTIGIFLTIVLSLAIGILISVSTHRYQTAFFIGLCFFLIQSFLIGIFLSLDLIIQSQWLNLASYSSPLFYPVRLTQFAWLANQPLEQTLGFEGDFKLDDWDLTILADGTTKSLSYVTNAWFHAGVSLILIGGISGLSLTLFINYKPR